MSFLTATSTFLSKILSSNSQLAKFGLQQTRNKYCKARLMRDLRRRRLAEEYAPERLRLVSMKRNDILPVEIRNLASQGFDNIPRQSSVRQLRARCVVTARGHGTVIRWRISRFIFRHLVDYNKMAGVQRAMW